MGFAICRFSQETKCGKLGSQEWHVNLPDLKKMINVPSLWKHYMIDHLVQPTEEEREIVMNADACQAYGVFIGTRGAYVFDEVKIMYVERSDANEYSHKTGSKPDTEFIEKLEKILQNIEPNQTKGINLYR